MGRGNGFIFFFKYCYFYFPTLCFKKENKFYIFILKKQIYKKKKKKLFIILRFKYVEGGLRSWGEYKIYKILIYIFEYNYYWVKVVTYTAVIFLYCKPCVVGKSMIYMLFLLDELIVCGIDFSNTL